MQPRLVETRTRKPATETRENFAGHEYGVELTLQVDYDIVLPALQTFLEQQRTTRTSSRKRAHTITRLGDVAAFQADLKAHPSMISNRSLILSAEEADGVSKLLETRDPTLSVADNGLRYAVSLQLSQLYALEMRRQYAGTLMPVNENEGTFVDLLIASSEAQRLAELAMVMPGQAPPSILSEFSEQMTVA